MKESVSNTKKHFKNTKVTILTDNPNRFNIKEVQIVDVKGNTLGENHRNFTNITRQNIKFRDGFWMKASQRLFVLEDYLTANQLDNILHLENDCLISFSEKENNIFGVIPEEILIPRESLKRAVLPLMIIKSRKTYVECMSEFNRILLKSPEIDEMEIFAKILDSNKYISNLPAISSKEYLVNSDDKEYESLSNNVQITQGLFDPSIYGQFLFGQDPTNNRYLRRAGYRNTNTNIATEKIRWQLHDDGEYLKISVSSNGVNYIKLNNLHAHGKYLVPLVSENYKSYLQLIKELNDNQFETKFAKELFMHNLISDPKIIFEFTYQWISFLKRMLTTNFLPRIKSKLEI
jgi:hypothetical protein